MTPMISSRSGAVAFVSDRNVYVVGGEVRDDHPASTLMEYDGTRWSQKPFRSLFCPSPGTLIISPSRMTMVSMDNSWDFKSLSCTSVQESDAFLKFDYKKLQRLENGLNSQPSIERVHEFMRLFQLALEWDEEHRGSHQHGKIAIQIRKLLTQPHITKILDEEGVGSDYTVANVAENNDFFISDDDDEEETNDYDIDEETKDDEVETKDDEAEKTDTEAEKKEDEVEKKDDEAEKKEEDNESHSVFDDSEMACPDRLVPGVIDVRPQFVDDDPSAMTLLDDCFEDPVDVFDSSKGHSKPKSVPSFKAPVTTLPRVVSPDQGKVKVSTIVNSEANDSVAVSLRVVSPDRGRDKASKTTDANKKAAAILHPVVGPDQGRSKAPKTPTKHPIKTPPQSAYPDRSRRKSSKIADGDTVATSESSLLTKQTRGIIFKAPSRKVSGRPAIPLRAVHAICDDDASTEGFWV